MDACGLGLFFSETWTCDLHVNGGAYLWSCNLHQAKPGAQSMQFAFKAVAKAVCACCFPAARAAGIQQLHELGSLKHFAETSKRTKCFHLLWNFHGCSGSSFTTSSRLHDVSYVGH